MNVDELAQQIRELNAQITRTTALVANLSVQRKRMLHQLQDATDLSVRELGFMVDLSGSRVQGILGPRGKQKKSPDQ